MRRNELLVTGKSASGEPEGLAPSMGKAFAEKLGVPVERLGTMSLIRSGNPLP